MEHPVNLLTVRDLGLQSYQSTLDAMRKFTRARGKCMPDEIWFLQHPAVYTRGVSCRDVPWGNGRRVELVDSDRGGQITYHGPGQLIAYLMFDLRRRGLGVRQFVDQIDQVIVQLLANHGVTASIRPGAPGVYVAGAKVAALGLRIRNGCTYHGVSLNVDMDLSPFSFIDPCGYEGLAVTQLKVLGVSVPIYSLQEELADLFAAALGYSTVVAEQPIAEVDKERYGIHSLG